MAKSFDDLIQLAKRKGKKKVAVACSHDHEVILAVQQAVAEDIIEPILIGDRDKILSIAEELKFDCSSFEVIDEKDGATACEIATKKVSSGEAQVLMKGLIDTGIIMKQVLNKEYGLRTGKVISHVALFHIPTYHKLLFVTDCAMNVAPDLNQKKEIIENAIGLAHSMGIEKPKVAVLAAKEKVDPKMQATTDADELKQMCVRGEFGSSLVDGPFALDNAVSEEACRTKGIVSGVGGDADIVLVPMIEAGNIFYKSLTILMQLEPAGLILGTKKPIVLTSRSDSDKAKLNSIALAVINS